MSLAVICRVALCKPSANQELCRLQFWQAYQYTRAFASTFTSTDHALPHNTAGDAASQQQYERKKKIVFLGTPSFAAEVLRDLIVDSARPDCKYEVAAIVTREHDSNKSSSRCSAVEAVATELGHGALVLTPATAREEGFLQHLAALQPDLCITAAYGCMLPQRFLDIPALGTLNVHPSLLPQFRGPAPVQRAVQRGVRETGVSLAYTVLKCDAGPVVVQQKVAVDDSIQAPELTDQLFKLGSQLLLQYMPSVLSGAGRSMAQPQHIPAAPLVYASKVTREETYLNTAAGARACHNQVRAFAEWPTSRLTLELEDKLTGTWSPIEVKILRTRVGANTAPSTSSSSASNTSGSNSPDSTTDSIATGPEARTGPGLAPIDAGHSIHSINTQPNASLPHHQLITWKEDAMCVPCGQHSVLEVLEVGRRKPGTTARLPLSAADFRIGLGKRRLRLPGAFN